MNLTVGFSVIFTINEFAPGDTTQSTPLSPAVPFDAPPTAAIDNATAARATVLPDNTIQVDGLAPGNASVGVSVAIGGQTFTASVVVSVAAVQPPPPVVGSIALVAGTPFPTPTSGSATAAAAHPGSGLSIK